MVKALDEPGMSVQFRVHVNEADADEPRYSLVHDISGKIILEGDDGFDADIGRIHAHLFNLTGFLRARVHPRPSYEMRSIHLAETFNVLCDCDTGFPRSKAVALVGFVEPFQIEWHLVASSLYIKPEFRGNRHGLRALHLLRQYAQRANLFVSACAFPEEPGQEGKKPPTATEIQRLGRYYMSDTQLGFKKFGPLTKGWLVADWSC